jgi:hypothetical protein
MELKEMDSYIYSVCGSYVLSALSVAIEHCLVGKKAKSEYIDKTIMKKIEEDRPLTEDEKKIQRNAFVTKMMAMKANFDAMHKSDD